MARAPYSTKTVAIMKGETRSPEFIKINPYHCLPTLRIAADNAIWESNTVLRYLADFNNDNDAYPTDKAKRALVDQLLDYRQTVLYTFCHKASYQRLKFHPAEYTGEADQKNIAAAGEELKNFANAYLKDGKFAGGFDKPTIADYALNSAMEFLKVIKDLKWPTEVDAYLQRFRKAVPAWEKEGATMIGYRTQMCS